MTGKCGSCGRTMGLDARGNLNRHQVLAPEGTRFAGSTFRQPRCEGTGKPPVLDGTAPKSPAPYTIEVQVHLKSRGGYSSLHMGKVLIPAQTLADADKFMDLLKGKKE